MTEQSAEDARKARGLDWFHYVMTQPRTQMGGPMVKVASNDFCFGDVWSRPGLDMRARRMITLACVAMTGAEVPIRTHAYAALKSGDVTFAEMQEVILHFSVYAGLPRAAALEPILAECWARVQAEGGPVKMERPKV